jgi:pyrroline-5-carboxylate reductase
MKIGIVGVGNLGGALAELLLVAGFCRDDMVLVTRESERSVARCARLGLEPQKFDLLRNLDVLVVTVKPQDAAAVCEQLRPVLAQDAVVLSMMAGVRCEVVKELTGHAAVARAMPNLGAVVGESATAYYVPNECTAAQAALVERVVKVCGRIYRVDQEELLDLATAVAGSGPAYLCWLGEQIEHVAVAEGFSPNEAHSIVLQTFKGAVAYLEHGGESFSEMRARVTSPHGTTAAALEVLSKSQADEAFRGAVRAALERSRSLGRH